MPRTVPGIPATTPVGVRDFAPEHAAEFYRLEQTLTQAFDVAGYRRVLTPAFELAHVFERGLGPDEAARVLRFVDPQNGEVLALRSDITPQIARMMAGPLHDAPLPARLSYFGRVFRLRQHSEFQRREVAQAGVELLGAAGVEADVEIITLCVSALNEATSRTDPRLSIGHAAALHAALDGLDITADTSAALRRYVQRKDGAGLRALAASVGVPGDRATALAELTRLYGAPEGVLPRARALAATLPTMTAGLDRIEAVLDGLADAGVAPEGVLVDLGEPALGFGYYTGIVFRAYVPGVGQAVASGGRYDDLVARYGRDLPAAGFAIDEEGLTQARATGS